MVSFKWISKVPMHVCIQTIGIAPLSFNDIQFIVPTIIRGIVLCPEPKSRPIAVTDRQFCPNLVVAVPICVARHNTRRGKIVIPCQCVKIMARRTMPNSVAFNRQYHLSMHIIHILRKITARILAFNTSRLDHILFVPAAAVERIKIVLKNRLPIRVILGMLSMQC